MTSISGEDVRCTKILPHCVSFVTASHLCLHFSDSLDMAEDNKTLVTNFVLVGLTDCPVLQVPLFLVFLVIYLITMVGNLGLIVFIWKDPHLHTPMYFSSAV